MSKDTKSASRLKATRFKARRYSLAELVAQRIRRMRTNAYRISVKSGVNPSIVSRALSGKRLSMDVNTANKLAKALRIDPMDIFRAIAVGLARANKAPGVQVAPSTQLP